MMSLCKIAGLFAIVLTTTACVSSQNTSQNSFNEVPRTVYPIETTNTPEDNYLSFFAEEKKVAEVRKTKTGIASQYDIVEVQVAVPDYLVVSEADVYLPQADIVWREDPLGDRRAQVKTILTDALKKGTNALVGPQEVIMAVRVNTFHALTEKARNSVGGKHNVQFDYVLLDRSTGQPVTSVKSIDASLKAFGGAKAYRAMRNGQTQKVRISNHVAGEIQAALRLPAQS